MSDDGHGLIGGIIRDHVWLWTALILGYLAAVDLGWIGGFEMPNGSGLVVMAAVLIAIGGWWAAGKIEGLLPDDHGIYLPVVNAYGEPFQLWELSEDKWADLEVVNPPLKHLPEAKHRAYECFAYDPDRNVAVSTWRHSLDGSDVVGHNTAQAALDVVAEVRDDLEQEARYGRALRRQLPSVVRRLDRRRAMEQNRALDDHLTPSFGSGESLDDLLTEELPADVLPDRLNADDADALAEGDDGDMMGFEVLADDDALDPVANGQGEADE